MLKERPRKARDPLATAGLSLPVVAARRDASGPPPAARHDGPDYRLGAIYAIVAAALIALQEPFSALAARSLHGWDFIGFTQVGLLASIPLLVARADARRDFVALLSTPAHWPKFVALLLIGLAGLWFYDLGLSSAHPIIAAAVLNLSPFWAALVSRVIAGKRLPGSPALFIGCLAFAFLGAMMIAWSQVNESGTRLWSDVLQGALHSHWILSLPMPIFFALSGTLVYIWFRDYDEGAAISANFVVSAAALIPLAIFLAWRRGETEIPPVSVAAILMLLIAVLSSSAAGRVFYQAALSATENDNGFVTMFFLVIPALSALLSWPLSRWIWTLHFAPSGTFFSGLILVTAPLLLFSFQTARKCIRQNAIAPRLTP
jgi:drug/metabolite transporter (DMT)-like permease